MISDGLIPRMKTFASIMVSVLLTPELRSDRSDDLIFLTGMSYWISRLSPGFFFDFILDPRFCTTCRLLAWWPSWDVLNRFNRLSASGNYALNIIEHHLDLTKLNEIKLTILTIPTRV